MSEKTIAVFKYGKDKYNLLEVTNVEIRTDGIKTDLKETYYLIIKNRKRIYRTPLEYKAKRMLIAIITENILQLKISL